MECTAALTIECVSTVFSAGFFLTVGLWTMGITIGVGIGVIKKL